MGLSQRFEILDRRIFSAGVSGPLDVGLSERAGWLHRAQVGLTSLALDMQWLGRTRLTLLVDHTVVRTQLSVPAGGICSGQVCCRLLPNISATGGSLDIASRVVSAGECARPVVVAAFVHGELCLGESSRLVSALPLFSAPVPVLPAHPLHFPPRRSRFAHAALSSSSRPPGLRAVHRPPTVLVPTACSASPTAAGVAPWRRSTVSSVEVSSVSSPLLRRGGLIRGLFPISSVRPFLPWRRLRAWGCGGCFSWAAARFCCSCCR
nr:uncharacterized protein LOC127328542 [Lolium perenne]